VLTGLFKSVTVTDFALIRPPDFSADHHRARMNNLPGALFAFMRLAAS
jgi:hypothetical protein